MEKIAIVGVGLIGASFGLALRRAGFSGDIAGVSSPGAIQAALQSGAISRECSLHEAAQRADLIYLAQPVDRILQTIESLGPIVRPCCLITDAGSTKRAIVQKAEQSFATDVFLGGHPMAGKELRGADAADATLFQGRTYVLTPRSKELPQMKQFESWLRAIGARIVLMSPEEHDIVVAFTSHLPQLLSNAISVTLAEQGNFRLAEVFGQGLLDMTRLAMSSPEMWESVLDTNRDYILDALRKFTNNLQWLQDSLRNDVSLHEVFSVGHTFASRLRENVIQITK
jgi:prephenate dehydrogenase